MDAPSHRTLGLLGILVFVLLAFGAVVLGVNRGDDPGPPFVADQVSTDLRDATADLIGYPPDGPESLDDALDVADRSVGEMSTLDDATYRSTWGQGAQDQAELVGRWLGLATRELGGGDLDRITRATVALGAAAPDEPTDNPAIPGAETLRDTLQSAFSAATD